MRLATLIVLTITLTWAELRAADLPADAARLIHEAGNTEQESERLAALEKLAALPLEPTLSAEAEELTAFVRLWNPAAGRLNFFLKNFGVEAQTSFKDYAFQIRSDSPLRPIAELYRGRMFAWYLVEAGNLRGHREVALRYKAEALKSFRAAEAAFPENRIPGMYLGRPIPWPKNYPHVAAAPEWAELQRENLDRFRDIIYWWIDHRQQADGSFGGGWGDDCEMRRWWSPLLLCFDDPKIVAAQIRFSTQSLARPEMQHGFLSRVRDVEHSAEDSTDNLIPLLLLQPEEPRWRHQAEHLVNLMQQFWTGRNGRGELQFRGFHFGATEVDPDPEFAYDVLGNVTALSPAFSVWEQTRDPQLGKPLTAWLDTWVAAAARAENGKPAGILPAAIRWPDGQVAGAAGRWWEPLPLTVSGSHWYVWPGMFHELTDALLTAYVVTGNDKYLTPIRTLADVRLRYLKHPPAEQPSAGSEAWCAAALAPVPERPGSLVRILVELKKRTGTQEFDELIALDGADGLPSGADHRRAIEANLAQSAALLRDNFASFTSEVRYTDRVLAFRRFLLLSDRSDGMTGVAQPSYDLLYRMAGGDDVAGRIPRPAVRWLTPPTDLAAWVTTADPTHFEAQLYHFGNQPRTIGAELRRLRTGRYRVELIQDGRPIELASHILDAKDDRSRISFELPPQKVCTLRVTEQPPK